MWACSTIDNICVSVCRQNCFSLFVWCSAFRFESFLCSIFLSTMMMLVCPTADSTHVQNSTDCSATNATKVSQLRASLLDTIRSHNLAEMQSTWKQLVDCGCNWQQPWSDLGLQALRASIEVYVQSRLSFAVPTTTTIIPPLKTKMIVWKKRTAGAA